MMVSEISAIMQLTTETKSVSKRMERMTDGRQGLMNNRKLRKKRRISRTGLVTSEVAMIGLQTSKKLPHRTVQTKNR